jgi:hypothetical protein
MKYELHEACSAWPQMELEALKELAEDIKANGLKEAIALTPDGKLLNGRNRALACEMAGYEIPADKVTTYSGDPWLYGLRLPSLASPPRPPAYDDVFADDDDDADDVDADDDADDVDADDDDDVKVDDDDDVEMDDAVETADEAIEAVIKSLGRKGGQRLELVQPARRPDQEGAGLAGQRAALITLSMRDAARMRDDNGFVEFQIAQPGSEAADRAERRAKPSKGCAYSIRCSKPRTSRSPTSRLHTPRRPRR